MEIGAFLPEDIILDYDFSPFLDGRAREEIIVLLINYFNADTLRHYRNTKTFLSPLTIYKKIPEIIARIKDNPRDFPLPSISIPFSTPSSTKERLPRSAPKVHWTADPVTVEKFKEYLTSHYEKSPTPTVKIGDLLKGFTVETGLEVGTVWSAKLEPLFTSLGIQVEQIPNPRYPQSSGTYHAYLNGKLN